MVFAPVRLVTGVRIGRLNCLAGGVAISVHALRQALVTEYLATDEAVFQCVLRSATLAAVAATSSRGKGLGVEGQDPKTHPPAGLKTLRLSSRHESRLKTQSPPATSFFGGSVFVDKL